MSFLRIKFIALMPILLSLGCSTQSNDVDYCVKLSNTNGDNYYFEKMFILVDVYQQRLIFLPKECDHSVAIINDESLYDNIRKVKENKEVNIAGLATYTADVEAEKKVVDQKVYFNLIHIKRIRAASNYPSWYREMK